MTSAPNAPDSSKPQPTSIPKDGILTPKRRSSLQILHLPRNVYLLLLFTTGKGFQLTIATLNITYYAHSLGYNSSFIGILSAMPAIGALISAVPSGLLADRLGRKTVLVGTAILTPLFLAAIGLGTSAPWLLVCSLLQGAVSSAYWVTNLPLLVESTTERQRIGVLALNSFLLLGIGSLGNLLGGAIPEFVGGLLHVAPDSTIPLRWGVLSAALSTLLFGLPLWFLHEPKRASSPAPKSKPTIAPLPALTIALEEQSLASATVQEKEQPLSKERWPIRLFVQLLLPDLLFTMGEGAVVALIQLYFVLRFHLLPGPLGVVFTISGLAAGIFSLTAPLFVRRWSKLSIVTTVQYISAPLMILIGFAPTFPLALSGEYARSFLRTLIEPVYAAFAMEQVSDRQRGTLSGFYSVTWSIGFSIGPVIAGWLQTYVSLSASFLFGACCLILSASLLLLFFGKRKGRPSPNG